MINTRAIGNVVEDIAVNHLQQHGLSIIERNFSCRMGEIDIICLDQVQQDLVFVEVRYRKNIDFGTPIESINYKKQQKLTATANMYIQSKTAKRPSMIEPNYRFDVVGVSGDLTAPEIEWLRNVIFL